jgi:glucoamylase
MPLVWAHAKYVKLLRSLADGVVFDMPPLAARRYRQGKHQARCWPWREDCPVAEIPAGRALRLDFAEPAIALYTAPRAGAR